MTTHLIFFFCLHDFNYPGYGVSVQSLLSCHSMGTSFRRINHASALGCTEIRTMHSCQAAFPSRLLSPDLNKRMAFNAEPDKFRSCRTGAGFSQGRFPTGSGAPNPSKGPGTQPWCWVGAARAGHLAPTRSPAPTACPTCPGVKHHH